MVKLDELLSVIENPARRKILEALVREPHYPLQLSKELGMSQQAVMKHLKVLEAYHLVKSFQEESDLGGPMRNRYYTDMNFTIVVDLGPNIFNAELLTRETPGPTTSEREAQMSPEERDARVKELRERIADIEAKLEALHKQREELIEEKERTMDEVIRLTAGLPDYQSRRIMYEFISHPDLQPEELARILSIRDDVVMRYLKEWLEE